MSLGMSFDGGWGSVLVAILSVSRDGWEAEAFRVVVVGTGEDSGPVVEVVDGGSVV